jgi:hypothetical protein
MEIFEMEVLERIKRHFDEMGVGCVVMSDHVAIYQTRITRGADGALQRSEVVQRIRTMQEACGVLGCDCSEPHDVDEAECPTTE